MFGLFDFTRNGFSVLDHLWAKDSLIFLQRLSMKRDFTSAKEGRNFRFEISTTTKEKKQKQLKRKHQNTEENKKQ